MKKITLFMIIIVLSCAGNMTKSSNIIGEVPKYLGVAVFDGSYPYNNQASSQFAHGLVEMGYLVMEQIHLPQIISEQRLQGSGVIDQGHVSEIGKMYGVSGMFVGSVHTVFTNHYLDTYLYIRLIDVETGQTIWSVNAKEPRYFTLTYDLSTSVYHTTNKALKHFKKDMRRIK
jgi:hypothetical protein